MDDASFPDLPGYVLRPPERSESRAVAELVAACDIAEGAEPGYTEADILEIWGWSSFDLAKDAWVVEAPDGSLAAYAELADEGGERIWFEATGEVHPSHRGRGIGSGLVTAYERRARDLMAAAGRDEAELWAFTSALDELGVELLRRNGYSPKRQFWHMRIELEGRTFEPKTVPGVSVRPADLNLEAPNIHELMEAGFSEHWGFSPSTFDDWSVVMRRPDFDAGLWLIAEAEGRIVGGAIGSLGDVPFIRDLAVLKEWRGRGIGAALLEASFAEFARRGVPNVTLNVDAGNETGAVALYERVGMQPIRRFVGAVKELRD